MKNKTMKGLIFFTTVSIIATGCDLMKDVTYTVTPNPLEMHADSVRVTIEAKLPEKGLKKKASAEITPMLGSTPLKPIIVQGEKVKGNGNTVQYKAGGTITYNDVVAYKPEMEHADLTVSGTIKKGGKEKDQIPVTKIADATIVTPLLVQKDFKVIMETDNFNRVTEKTLKVAQINFDKGKSELRKNETKEMDIVEFQNWLLMAQINPKINLKTIKITGYASPEGEVGFNNNLSSDRANTGKMVAIDLAKKAGNAKAQGEVYLLEGRGEDYDGFKVELEKSAMNNDEKQLIIRVLEMYKDPVQRETEMRNLGKTFTYLDKNIFPLLRRAEFSVVYDQTGYSDEELSAISKTNPEKLTAEELMFTATLTDDLAEKLRIYNEGTLLYPMDVRFHNNAGAVLYMQNNLDEAGFKFEAANSLQDNAISKNNLGAIAAKKGDKAKAKQLFASAKGAGSEVDYNLGIYAIQEGNYADAIAKFGSEASFNKALAQILNDSPDAGVKTIDASPAKETGWGYYLKAVAAARMDKVDIVATNLKSAIAKDPSLKAKAAKDREFLKYFENPTFTGVVK